MRRPSSGNPTVHGGLRRRTLIDTLPGNLAGAHYRSCGESYEGAPALRRPYLCAPRVRRTRFSQLRRARAAGGANLWEIRDIRGTSSDYDTSHSMVAVGRRLVDRSVFPFCKSHLRAMVISTSPYFLVHEVFSGKEIGDYILLELGSGRQDVA